MAKDVSPTDKDLRVFIVPDPRLTYVGAYSPTLSVVTQAGPKPGIPDPQQDTKLVLEASGTQESGGSIDVQCLAAGMPAPDRASFVWKNTADSASHFRGWEPPFHLGGFEFLDHNSTAGRWRQPHAITLKSGVVLVVAVRTSRYIVLWRRGTGGVWTNQEIFDNGVAFTFGGYPCLTLLDDDRVALFFWQEDGTANENQVRMHYSSDDGVTWHLGQAACLATALDTSTYTPRRLRAVQVNGQILLMAGVRDATLAYQDVLAQYASSDIGARFDALGTWQGNADSAAAFHDLVVVGDQAMLAYIREGATSAATYVPYVRFVSSAFELFSGAVETVACQDTNPMEWATRSAGPNFIFSDGDLAVCLDEDGVLYMVGRDHDNGGGALKECYTQRSIDGGETWKMCGSSAAVGFGAAWWQGLDLLTFPRDLCVVSQTGRLVVPHVFAANPGANDDSLSVAYLGGYSTVTLPGLGRFPVASSRVAWERTWVAYDMPEDTGGQYGLVSTNAPTITLTSDGVRVQDGGAGTSTARWATATPPVSTLPQGLVDEIWMRVVAGSGYIRVQIANATPVSYEARVTVTGTTITVTDETSGTTLGTDTITAGVGVAIRVGVGNADAGLGNTGETHVWFRQDAAGGAADREWTQMALTGNRTMTAGAAANNTIRFGVTAGAGTDVYFRWNFYSYGVYAGETTQALYLGQANPDSLFGRAYAPTPQQIPGGVRIAAIAGPAFFGDLHIVAAAYEHGVERIHVDVSPSPAETHRSVAETQQDYVWEYDHTIDQETPLLGPTLGVALFNMNYRQWSLAGYDKDTSAYVTLVAGDTAAGQSGLRFIREGNLVRVDGGIIQAAEDYFTYNILADSHIELTSLGDEPTTVIRRISTNSEGAWNSEVTKHPRLLLDGVLPTDPSSGTARIWGKDIVCLVHNPEKYTRYRLRIAAQATAEGFLETGAVVIGHAFVMARQNSWGRIQEGRPNTRLTTLDSGLRRSRRLGATRRVTEIPWTQLVNAKAMQVPRPAPPYVKMAGTATEPAGVPSDTLYAMGGLVEALGGSDGLVVYVDSVPRPASASTVTTILNRNRFMLCRITNEAIRREDVMGNEWSNMVSTMPSVTLEEEV